MQAEIDKAQSTAEAANAAVDDLDAYMEGAFKDGVINTAEAKVIGEQMNAINETKASADNSYTTIYANTLLTGDAKENLASAKSDLDAKQAALIDVIKDIITAQTVTGQLHDVYNSLYFYYRQSYGEFSLRLGEATKYIEDAIKGVADNAQDAANQAQSTANEAVQATQAVNDYVQALESDVNAELVAVNRRLDGVIENHFELYDPTLTNYPANEWTTDKLKEDHNGDTFTNKTTGNSWKWKIIGGAWKWDEITDTFEKELLNKIAKAQATADGKIRNFVFEPYPPYSVGDTWSQGSGGDMMRCIRSRTSGVFDPSDWDKASKYTDDAVAEEAKKDAEEAKNAADAANAKIADIASDGKLTPPEKQDALKEKDRIAPEHSLLVAQAERLLLNTTAYISAFDALNSYLEPLLSDLASTSDIEGDTFRAKFAAYYDAKVSLMQDIQAVTSGNMHIRLIDLTALAPNTCYPLTLAASVDKRAHIRVYADLNTNKAPWSTHTSGGFALDCTWNTVGSGWGTILDKRYIEAFQFNWTDGFAPAGSIGQIVQRSLEYIYLRGGGTYFVQATNVANITLHEQGYIDADPNFNIPILPVASIDIPKVDVEEARLTAEQAKQKLTDWSSDSIISPVEKTGLRQRRSDIISEYERIKVDAQRYKVATANYTAAYTAAILALDKYTSPLPAEIAVEDDYDNIAAYYYAREVIEKSLGSAADVSRLQETFEGDDTQIQGGIVLSSFMGVRDSDNIISAGMSGYGELPFVFAGLGEGSDIVEKAKNALFRVDRDAGLGQWGILKITKDAVLITNTNGQVLEFRNSDIESLGQLIGGSIPVYNPTGVFSLTGLLPPAGSAQSKRTVETNIYARNSFVANSGGLELEVISTVSSNLIRLSGPSPDRASVAIKVSLYNSFGRVIDTSDTTYINVASTSASTVNVISKLNISTAGTYYLGFKLTAEGHRAQMIDAVSEFVSKIDVTKNVVNFNFATQRTVIGTNGYAIVYGNRDYLYAVKNNDTKNFELRMSQQHWPANDSSLPIGGVYKDAAGFLRVKQ